MTRYATRGWLPDINSAKMLECSKCKSECKKSVKPGLVDKLMAIY